MRPVGSG